MKMETETDWKITIGSPVDYSFKNYENLEETTISDSGLPVDYSFKDAIQLSQIAIEGPRTTRMGKNLERGEKRKYLTRSIWLNNNKLNDIKGTDIFVERALEQPSRVGWLDFSFNNIKEIDESILKCTELRLIYFHGNSIESLDEILKLRGLKQLRGLTLHGNPICELPSYRSTILFYLPKLVKLDFFSVLKEERLQPITADAQRKLRAWEENESKKKSKPA